MVLLGGVFDFIFGPLINNLSSPLSLISISFFITLFITLPYKFLTNQQLMKLLKEEIDHLKKEMKEHKDNKEKFNEINQKIMTKSLELSKQSLKPMLFTLLPIFLIFSWMRETYLPVGDLFSWGFSIPFFGTGIGWLWTYLFSSMVFNILLRKALKIH